MELQNSNIVVKQLVGKYNPQKTFSENKTVKRVLSDNFKKQVLNGAKIINGLPRMSFSKYQFTETIYDKEMMEHFKISKSYGLMTREEILYVIDILTNKQPNGEEGILQINGNKTIIGYILCDDGVIRVVRVYWISDDFKWRCICSDLIGWGAGWEVLSRNL